MNYRAQDKDRREVRRLSKQQLRRLMAFVEGSIEKNISVANMSSEVKMSSSYFGYCFKMTVGMTPHAFVTRFKMLKAAQFLTELDCSLEQIAEKVGFSNVGHFRKQFRKYLGCNPSHFRLTATPVCTGSIVDLEKIIEAYNI
jgi:AraC family transcriptional regulator